MMATTTDLTIDIYDHLTETYVSRIGSDDVVVAFEALAISPAIDPATAGAAGLAARFMSDHADIVPDLSGGLFVTTGNSVCTTYNEMLKGSKPSSSTDAATFAAMQSTAQQKVQNVTSGTQTDPQQSCDAAPTPATWYDPGIASDWISYSYSVPPGVFPDAVASGTTESVAGATTSSNAASTTASSPAAHARLMPPPWRFMGRLSIPVMEPLQQSADPSPLPVGRSWRPVFPVPTPLPAEAPAMRPFVVDNYSANPELVQHVTISFEYCLVTLDRPWMSNEFLSSRGWYVPGLNAGSYTALPDGTAQGPSLPAHTNALSASVPASPATRASGAFSWLPVACVVVRNFVMSAPGNAPGVPVGYYLTSFGPFMLSEVALDELRHPGVQLVAWICRTTPELPPDGDPAQLPHST